MRSELKLKSLDQFAPPGYNHAEIKNCRRREILKRMTKQEFLRALEGELALPVGSLKGNSALAELEGWDSMAAVQFIALADEKIGVSISGHQINTAKTIDQLVDLLGDRLAV
jgi:acyl carrier protein